MASIRLPDHAMDGRFATARIARDRFPHARLTANTALRPPNAKEFEMAWRSDAARATLGTTSRAQSGSGSWKFAVGGMVWVCSASAVAANSNAPAAPRL